MPRSGITYTYKYKILQSISPIYRPKMMLIQGGRKYKDFNALLSSNALSCPLIIKPDNGYCGKDVIKVKNSEELAVYVSKNNGDYIIQEFIADHREFGVFCIKDQHDDVRIISLVEKSPLTLLGNGYLSVHHLSQQHRRPHLAQQLVAALPTEKQEYVPRKNEKFTLSHLGNHSQGAEIFDRRHEITPKLENVFKDILSTVSGFHYGRFDVMAKCLEDLEEGKLYVLELNGAGSELLHIYDDNYPSLLSAYKEYITNALRISNIINSK